MPDGNLLLTERNSRTDEPGRLWVVTTAGGTVPVAGLPTNKGVLDVALFPAFASNRLVYLTFMEGGAEGEPRVGRAVGDASLSPAGLAVATGELTTGATGTVLSNVKVIWRQTPKIVSYPGSGEPGGRMAFSPDGVYLFIAAGDRQEFDPVQQLDNTIGKIVRLFADGRVPADNPYVGTAGARPEIWTLGHRNPYGLAFNAAGQLWSHEQGPKGGDEFNLVSAGG